MSIAGQENICRVSEIHWIAVQAILECRAETRSRLQQPRPFQIRAKAYASAEEKDQIAQ